MGKEVKLYQDKHIYAIYSHLWRW